MTKNETRRDGTRRHLESVNRVGGKLVYRAVGSVAAVPAIAAIVYLGRSISHGDWVGIAVFSIVALLFGRLVAWCFSPRRRLTDIEP